MGLKKLYHQVPPYACSFVFSMLCAYFCDKYKNRGVMTMVCPLLAAIGFSMFLGALVQFNLSIFNL
jgi:peptidoglycan/LPS O-acetylase OafA/YrhL